MTTRDAEHIRGILDRLVCERQDLRRTSGNERVLEANRLALVYWQQQLQRALLAEHAQLLLGR
jgi:hypothetical protein